MQDEQLFLMLLQAVRPLILVSTQVRIPYFIRQISISRIYLYCWNQPWSRSSILFSSLL